MHEKRVLLFPPLPCAGRGLKKYDHVTVPYRQDGSACTCCTSGDLLLAAYDRPPDITMSMVRSSPTVPIQSLSTTSKGGRGNSAHTSVFPT